MKAFLQGVYAHYKSSQGDTFDPLGRNLPQVFDKDMGRLMAEDTRLLKGDLGAIDGDWLCQCQDFDSIVATITVHSTTPTTAKASADFKVFDRAQHNDFDLVKEDGAWRIHDMRGVSADDPHGLSLRETLEQEIRDLQKPAAKKPVKGDEAP
ncbi:MAG TPA: DUF3828 domain-containing protein [Caulobacteraceae bacterium]|nr:DUF3828 domain-containing protein [Caulobacteraceae bacterium]